MIRGGGPPKLHGRWEVMNMGTYEVLTLLILFGTFLISLLAYIDRNNKRK